MNQTDYGNAESVSHDRTPPGPPFPDGRETILLDLTAMVTAKLKDWDRDVAAPLDASTMLVADLGYQSLDITILIVTLWRQLNLTGIRDIPFERLLLVDGTPISDLSLGKLTDFLWEEQMRTPV
jgi:hypothetical protein